MYNNNNNNGNVIKANRLNVFWESLMCQLSTVNDVIDARKREFLAKYSVSENSLYQVFARVGNLL